MIFITRGYSELASDNAVMSALLEHADRVSQYESCSFLLPKNSHISSLKHSIYHYRTIVDLLRLIRRSSEINFFASEFFSVLLIKMMRPFSSKVIYWVQGSIPHESFMRNASYSRFYILSALEYIGLVLSSSIIYVSDSMRDHYHSRYPFVRKIFYKVIPCASRLTPQKVDRKKNKFVYIGGMAKWQSFDLICQLFTKILSSINDAEFLVITRDKNIALECLQKNSVSNYSVISLDDPNEIGFYLSSCQYGFLIRDDSIVNKVSSPIKLAEYLSCGVTPIITKSVLSFKDALQGGGSAIVISYENAIYEIVDAVTNCNADSCMALASYDLIYNRETLLFNTKSILKNI